MRYDEPAKKEGINISLEEVANPVLYVLKSNFL